ncbi:MAG: hypothetical protein L7W43_19730 [Rubripirellula sp.]|nr:hypothetical protein [Rubripirellula sp.]
MAVQSRFQRRSSRTSFPLGRFIVALLFLATVPRLFVCEAFVSQGHAQEVVEDVKQSKADRDESSDGKKADTETARRAFRADVLEWVDELDSPTLRVRKEAERSLLAAGPDALKYLPREDAVVSIEKSERLGRVREALKAARAKAGVDTKSTRVRLDKVTNLGDALAAISLASGIEFDHDSDASMPVNPVTAPLAFWHAVDIVLDQVNLDVNFYGGDGETLRLDPRSGKRPSRVDSAAYVGVYRLEPTSVASRRNIRQSELNSLNVVVEVSWEPRLTPIGLTIPVAQLSGKLNDGASLKPQESGGNIPVTTNAAIAFSEVYFPLQLPAGQPSAISSLSGVINALLPGEKKSFEIALAEPNGKKKIDAMTVQLESVRRDGPLHEIRVAIELDKAGRALESHRSWIFENVAYVRLKDGTKAEQLGFEVYRQTESGVGVAYRFDLGDNAEESTFVYRSSTSIVPNEVPFVIQDIPLP